ncbi:MAG: hypothetical protein ABL888_03615 [Pirellulaceae bacterium]
MKSWVTSIFYILSFHVVGCISSEIVGDGRAAATFGRCEVVCNDQAERVACEFATPWFGIGGYAIPISPPYLALKDPQLRTETVAVLKLSQSQQEACNKLLEFEELFAEHSDSINDWDEDSKSNPYEFLDEEQKWKLELLRFRLEGMAVLRRETFRRKLNLTDEQNSDIAKLINKYRNEKVGTLFQSTFASNLDKRIYEWRVTRWSIEFNLQSMRILSPEQQKLLINWANESSCVERLSKKLVERLLKPN